MSRAKTSRKLANIRKRARGLDKLGRALSDPRVMVRMNVEQVLGAMLLLSLAHAAAESVAKKAKRSPRKRKRGTR